MSDIDFDELDRAVNGALGGNDAPTESPSVNLVERTTLSPVSSTTAPAQTPTPASNPTPVATPTSQAPAARRSTGRFMDMVHPSSDMRSHPSARPAEARNQSIPPAQPELTVLSTVESPAWNEPLESPFLADAKVEKRPLGGGEVAAAEASAIVDSFDFQGLLDEEPEEELLEAPEAQERLEAIASPDPVELPDEIDPADAAALADAIEQKISEVEVPVAVEETPADLVPQQPSAAFEASQPPVEELVGPTSITPQYKEQASSNQESGAMYDTESYHQAVAAPVKKKSGWVTVLWILLLIILGAGGGWAVYTYVL